MSQENKKKINSTSKILSKNESQSKHFCRSIIVSHNHDSCSKIINYLKYRKKSKNIFKLSKEENKEKKRFKKKVFLNYLKSKITIFFVSLP